jgi:hypothetical protein
MLCLLLVLPSSLAKAEDSLGHRLGVPMWRIGRGRRLAQRR